MSNFQDASHPRLFFSSIFQICRLKGKNSWIHKKESVSKHHSEEFCLFGIYFIFFWSVSHPQLGGSLYSMTSTQKKGKQEIKETQGPEIFLSPWKALPGLCIFLNLFAKANFGCFLSLSTEIILTEMNFSVVLTYLGELFLKSHETDFTEGLKHINF